MTLVDNFLNQDESNIISMLSMCPLILVRFGLSVMIRKNIQIVK